MTPAPPNDPPYVGSSPGRGQDPVESVSWWRAFCEAQGWSCVVWLGVMMTAIVGFGLGCRSEKQPPVRIATSPWIGYSVFEVAEELGFFKEEGVEVHLVDQLSMADSRRSFEQNQVDAIACTLVEAILTQRPGQHDVNLIYAIDASHGADQILAAPEIQSVDDLRGRRIGYEPGSSDILVVHLALRRSGLTLKDVTLVPMNQVSMPDAARSRMVDALPSFPPPSHDIAALGWKALFDSSQTPGMIVDVLAIGSKTLETRREDWLKVIRALDRALVYQRQDPDAARALMERTLQIPRSEVTDSEAGIIRYGLPDQRRLAATNSLLAQALEKNLQALIDSGVLSSRPPRLPLIQLLGAQMPQEGLVP